jgi:hypothetical protein
MLQSFKKITWILLLVFCQQEAWAFSLGGPIGNNPHPSGTGFNADAWQISVIGYNIGGDLVAPKNIGEGYRRNASVYYYACDANFLDFFGSNGVVAVDDAFTIMNISLTNVDAYSAGLTEFPLNSQAINYTASGLGLLDLKSETLGVLVEQMGLANPVRFAWTLHDRFPLVPTCLFDYLVVQRNFDITASPLNQLQYSPYVNGTLYTYFIEEFCPGPVPDPQAVTVPVQVDPLQNIFAPVAGLQQSLVLLRGNFVDVGLQTGGFYTGLTRDDEAGLRYLLTTNYIAYESPATGSALVSSTGPGGTNYGAPFPLYTLDLATFIQAAKTTDPVTLSNLYPGLIITSSSATFALLKTTNYVAFFTNLIGAPAGSQTLVIVKSGVTQTVITNYAYTFANIVTNTYHSTSTAQLVVVQAQQLNGAPAGFLTTNITVQTLSLKTPSGDFYINTNVCGPNLIVSTLATNVTTTNQIILSATNVTGLFYAESKVTTSVTHILIAQPVVCAANSGGGSGTTTNSPGLYLGIGKVQFVKTTFDSLIGQFYQPITNSYTQVLVINSKPVKQTFQRVITTPDFLMTAADLAGGQASIPVTPPLGRTINFNQSSAAVNLAGPGTIDPGTIVTFDKVGTIYLNVGVGNQANGFSALNWASFDGSTNDPVLYPNGTSINNLANQILVQISPATLSDGTNGVSYPATTFVANGGAFSPPYTWSLSSGSLPAGLILSSGGTISGIPAQKGTFDFTLQLTDSLSRTVVWGYSLTIN